MTVWQLTAQCLLMGPAHIKEISAYVRDRNPKDSFSYKDCAGGTIWSEQIREFINTLVQSDYAYLNGKGFSLTPLGEKHCKQIINEANQPGRKTHREASEISQ